MSRDRSDFVVMACAMSVQPIGNAAQRKEHAQNLVATANAIADELGLGRQALDAPSSLELNELDRRARRIQELEEVNARLEAQLEQATAPTAAAAKKGAAK
jgi:hypothetical protein